MSASTMTQGTANSRRVSLRPETTLGLGTCERHNPFADAQSIAWSPKHNYICLLYTSPSPRDS